MHDITKYKPNKDTKLKAISLWLLSTDSRISACKFNNHLQEIRVHSLKNNKIKKQL